MEISQKIILLVLIASLFINGFLIYQCKETRKELTQQTEQVENLLSQIDRLEKEVKELKSSQDNTKDEIMDWKTYRSDYGNFEFSYPAEYNLRDFISQSNIDFDENKINFEIGADDIYTVLDADSPCGMVSQELYQEQKKALENSIPGYNFDSEFKKTDYEIKNSKIFINSNGVKIAYGISICQGLVDENDLGTFKFIAITFNKNMRIGLSFSLTEKQSGNIKVKNLELGAKEISKGKYNEETQNIYNDFLEILNSFKIL